MAADSRRMNTTQWCFKWVLNTSYAVLRKLFMFDVVMPTKCMLCVCVERQLSGMLKEQRPRAS